VSLPETIDTEMHGRGGLTAAFVVRGDRATALVETGPKSALDRTLRGLEAAGVKSLDYIVVTHIHLDHAGAAGALAQRWPRARVAVHEVGAPHLVDPRKLWSSAARIYGDEMERLWGGIDPIDAERVIALADGDSIDLGGRTLTAIDTPGHAYHHHAYLDDATGVCFAGDALGVRLQGLDMVRPATPPPEFDLEAGIASIERLAAVGPASLWLTHFGPSRTGVQEVCAEAIAALREWEGWVAEARGKSGDLDQMAGDVAERARAAAEGSLDRDSLERLEQATSYRMNVAGIARYLDRKAT
jgi:glyoxylase-like metal-dependent hydrolase (beta-lactamase superfamily II)